MNWNVGLDIGTCGVRMALRERGVIYHQSAAIATRGEAGGVVAVGDEAQRLISRATADIRIGFPMLGGTVADEQSLARWYAYLFRQVDASNLARRIRLLLAYPPEMPPSALRRMVALAMDSGAVSCSAVRQDIAAVLGALLPVTRPQATLIADLGAGRLGVSLLSAGRVVCCRTLPYGMSQINETIVRRLRRRKSMRVGPIAAEEIKLALGGASAHSAPRVTVHAMDSSSGFPRAFDVEEEDLKGAADPVISGLKELIYETLDLAPTELTADINDTGIVLTGGGARMFGLPSMIAETFSLPCHLPESPDTCVIRGVSFVMEAGKKYGHLVDVRAGAVERQSGV